MTRRFLPLSAAFCRLLPSSAALCLPMALAAQSAPSIVKYTAAGIPVIQKTVTANDVVAVRLYLKGGSAALTPATAGIEAMIGELATHGTEKYTRDQFVALATSTGTEIGSEAEYDYTVISAQAVRQNWNQAWDLFTQAALHPVFPADEVEQVQAQMLDVLKQQHDLADPYINRLADSMIYAGHPYAVDPEGSVEAVQAITRDALTQWHKRRFTKANLLLVVVGNVPRSDLEAKISAAFGSLPATGGEAPAAPPLGAGKRDLLVVERPLPTNYVMGAYAAPGPASPDFPAFRVATQVLGERLFEEIRTKRNLTYAVAAVVSNRAVNRGALYVTATQPDTTLKVMLSEVRKLRDELVPASRLGNVFLTTYLMSQQTNMGQGAELGHWEVIGGGWQNQQKFRAQLRAVTPAELQRVSQKYFQNARFVVIGDGNKIDRGLFTSLE
jgi:zinc protease